MAITRFQNTRVYVHVAIDDDTERVRALLLVVTVLISLATKAGLVVSSVALFVVDVAQAVDFTAKVFAIGIKSIAYGLGVTL